MQVCNVDQSVELAETDYPIVSHFVKGSKTPVERAFPMEMDIIRASMNEVVFMIIVSPSPSPKEERGGDN